MTSRHRDSAGMETPYGFGICLLYPFPPCLPSYFLHTCSIDFLHTCSIDSVNVELLVLSFHPSVPLCISFHPLHSGWKLSRIQFSYHFSQTHSSVAWYYGYTVTCSHFDVIVYFLIFFLFVWFLYVLILLLLLSISVHRACHTEIIP